MNMTISFYLEIKDAELYGGEGSIGYGCARLDIVGDNIGADTIKKYADAQLDGWARMCKVPVEKVRLISRTEYEKNTEDEYEDGGTWDD